MKSYLLGILSLACALAVGAAEPNVNAVEREVEAMVKSEKVTIVHFWASWCSNCKAEHAEDGWKSFVAANPDVTVVFVSIWGSDPGDRKLLEGYGLTEFSNFHALRHPNQSRKREDKVTQFLGRPVTWTPSTWVFRKGTLRYALNYGEVRFDILAQLVADTTASW